MIIVLLGIGAGLLTLILLEDVVHRRRRDKASGREPQREVTGKRKLSSLRDDDRALRHKLMRRRARQKQDQYWQSPGVSSDERYRAAMRESSSRHDVIHPASAMSWYGTGGSSSSGGGSSCGGGASSDGGSCGGSSGGGGGE